MLMVSKNQFDQMIALNPFSIQQSLQKTENVACNFLWVEFNMSKLVQYAKVKIGICKL